MKEGWGIGWLEENTDNLIKRLEELDLPVTKKASGEFKELVGAFKKSGGQALTNDLIEKLKSSLDKLDLTFSSEMALQNVYVLTSRRFDPVRLIETPGDYLAPNVYSVMSDMAQFDFSRACECLAFEQSTAVAFHLCRCVEGSLKDFYKAKVKRNRITSLMMGPIIADLRKRGKYASKVLLDHLDNFKNNFRNPTQHPDARYDIEEAQDLVFVAIDLLNRMHKS
jgi:hypothetical protein